MRTLLTVLLVIVLLALLAVLSWLVVLYLEWPLWGGIAIFFGVLALYFGLKALRRFVIVSSAKSRIIASQRASLGEQAQQLTYKQLLMQKWKAATTLLKSSQLKKFGNPLYVLPWYLVMGESGAGKTTAISRSRLTPMLRESVASNDIQQTANCDWWFFSQAVVLDTAGRYVSPDGSALDQHEWDYLLELFTKYRSKEGVNGLVVVIDAASLLAGNVDQIERSGQSLRDRIDQLMRLFEKRVPIYVMITKSDQIYGFQEWSASLSDTESQEAMGYMPLDKEEVADEQRFAQEAIDTLAKRLESLRLVFSMRGAQLSAEMLLFPNELRRLLPGLELFLKSVFGNNPYLERPYLRGLFLTSARQQEPAPSGLGELISPPSYGPEDRTKRKGLFIFDIFSRILPLERSIALPGQIVSRWRRVTANFAMIAWFSFCLSILIFLFISFQSTSETIKRFAQSIPAGMMAAALTEDAQSANQLRSSPGRVNQVFQSPPQEALIDQLSAGLVLVNLILKEESDWRTRWLAFSPEVIRLEDMLKRAYVDKFRQLQAADAGLDVKPLLESGDDTQRVYAALALARYINIIQARINGASYQQILAMPQIPKEVIQTLAPNMEQKVLSGFDELLAAAVGWSAPDDPYLAKSLNNDRIKLRNVVFQSPHMAWLVPWANNLPELQPVTLSQFWNPDATASSQVTVPAGLTLAGQGRIQGALSEIGTALQNDPGFVNNATSFNSWYQLERLNSWKGFAWGIMQGQDLIRTEPEYRVVISSLGTAKSPFALFFDRLIREFAALPSSQSPSWLEFARYYGNLVNQQKNNQGNSSNTMDTITAINTVAGQALRESFSSSKNLVPSAISRARNDITLIEKYVEARKKGVVDVLSGVNPAFDMTNSYFAGPNASGQPDAGGAKDNPVLAQMQLNLSEFKKNSRFNNPDDDVIWQVIEGSFKTVRHYAFEQASCKLQQDWQTNVMWKTQLSVSPQEVSEQLFGDQGSVWSFVDASAQNFVNRLGGSFVAAQRDNAAFPFAPGFIQFLNQAVTSRVSEVVKQKLAKASTEKSAKLTLAAMPMAVNQGAKAKPYAALLFVQCDQNLIELSNVNMQASDSFEWSPGKCGETKLEIEIDNMTLTKRYPGPTGLATMLQEFADGARVFTPVDFPAAAKQLDELEVREITLRYDMQGREDILQLAQDYKFVLEQTTPSTQPPISRLNIQVPARAGQCWVADTAAEQTLSVPRLIQKEVQKTVSPPLKPPEPPLPPVQPLEPAPTKQITVKAGDTLFSIAKTYKVDLIILKELNDLNNDTIRVGQKLLVPIWRNPPY